TTQSALASGIASMINGTKSFAEAVKGIWQSIAGFVVEQISQMIAKWLVFKALTAMAGGGGFFGGIAKGLLGSFQTQPGEWRQVPFDMPAMVHEDELIGRPPFPVSKSPAMTSQPTTIIENHYNISPHFSGIFPNDPEFYREITLTHMVPIIKEANENVSGSILD
ncbi:MAG: hypothetical protein KKD89_07030, partial [Candidatus Omnitrophica bacterium]|nr:hypothetical protein [Candidatus Omnitrophota bacterium]